MFRSRIGSCYKQTLTITGRFVFCMSVLAAKLHRLKSQFKQGSPPTPPTKVSTFVKRYICDDIHLLISQWFICSSSKDQSHFIVKRENLFKTELEVAAYVSEEGSKGSN